MKTQYYILCIFMLSFFKKLLKVFLSGGSWVTTNMPIVAEVVGQLSCVPGTEQGIDHYIAGEVWHPPEVGDYRVRDQ